MKKNVLISVANLELGGQQRMALLLADVLKEDYNVTFLVFTSGGDNRHYDFPQGVNVIDLECEPKKNYINKALNVLERTVKERRIKRKNNIAVSISFGESANIINALSRGREKVITSIRGSLVLQDGAKLIERMTIKKSDSVVFISKGQMRAYANAYPRFENKMRVIYNACEIERIRDLAKQKIEFEMDDDCYTAVGRLVDIKCFCNLINAFALLIEQRPEAKLYIIGDGRGRDGLSDYIVKRGLDKNIFLLGDKSNPFAYVSKSRALLNSSGRESFSNVVLEALACGVPVIATDCRFGPREILFDDDEYGITDRFEVGEYGILVPPFEIGKDAQPEKESIFYNAIRYLTENNKLEKLLKKKTIERSDRFSVQEYRKNWINIMQEVG